MKLFKKYTEIICILVLMLAFPGTSGFGEISAAASDRDRTGSISVELNDLGTNRTGVVFWLYDVSEIDASVTLSELSKLSVRETKEMAEQLEKKARQKNTEFLERTTDKDGRIVFSDMKEGTYLISQHARAEYGEVYPFLIRIPYSEEDGTSVYNVTAKPKGEISLTPTLMPSETPVLTQGEAAPPVKTGDENATGFYIILFLAAGMAVTAAAMAQIEKRR